MNYFVVQKKKITLTELLREIFYHKTFRVMLARFVLGTRIVFDVFFFFLLSSFRCDRVSDENRQRLFEQREKSISTIL